MSLFKIDTQHGRISWFIVLIVATITLLPFTALTTYVAWGSILLLLSSYALRVFCLTACYHRLLSHKAYKTSRVFRFIMTFICCTAMQGGPLWWASRHRHHHINSDQSNDRHSAEQFGFWHSHMLWFMYKENLRAEYHLVRDLYNAPELRLLERFWYVCPLVMVALLLGGGYWVTGAWSGAWNAVVWGFCVPAFFVNHATYFVNSLTHLFGRVRYRTADSSRNNWLVAVTTFGEGWHNNHHRYAGSARQGHAWYELDITYMLLKVLSWLRIVRDLRPVPQRILAEGGLAEDAPAARREPVQHST